MRQPAAPRPLSLILGASGLLCKGWPRPRRRIWHVQCRDGGGAIESGGGHRSAGPPPRHAWRRRQPAPTLCSSPRPCVTCHHAIADGPALLLPEQPPTLTTPNSCLTKCLLGKPLTKPALGTVVLDPRGLEQGGNFILSHVLLASSIRNLIFYQSNLKTIQYSESMQAATAFFR
ncbi:hypothetical protein BDA96_01G350600 [Sorghum bicolor]|uniref:Uncharacterized protein n=2 Tax=Sorghum bicolor TaxID=4558 RepID=A0A921UZN2_SORBI|nr:hypothetical protein BDA96_01G350600 [Sorghum bicolor]KXG39082.1 hypothetical protein SORBI_3001G327400 [Sorghum bicolor]